MADEQKPDGQAPTENKPDAGGAPAPSASTDAAPKEGEPKPGNEADAGKKPDAAPDPSKPAADDDEPPVRKTKAPINFILERKQRQLEKAKAAQAKPPESAPNAGDGGGEGADDDVSADDETIVEKVIEKKYGGYFNEIDQQREEAEMKSFLAENPHFKPYEAKIKKFAQHESRRHLPLSTIAYEVAGPDLMRIGAEKAKKADEEAAKSTTGGGTTRGEATHKPIEQMTAAEFREFDEKVKRGEIVLK